MFSYQKPKGSSLLISLGIMSVLLVLSGGISTLVIKSLRTSASIENQNKAYFAAEAGLEEALYDLSAHLSGYENNSGASLLNNSNYKYDIKYRTNGRIPAERQGNSPTDPDWNLITPQISYNLDLFYDKNDGNTSPDFDCTNGNCDIVDSIPSQFNLYLRTPNGETLIPTPDEVFLTWTLTGIDKDDPDTKFTLIPKAEDPSSEIKATVINNDENVLTNASIGKDLSNTTQSISDFFATSNLHMPRFKLSVTQELLDNTNKPIPYLEFYLDTNLTTLPDTHATITSEGYMAGSKQTLQTKIKQKGAISLFDYAVFQ